MCTKSGKVVTCNEEFASIKSHDPFSDGLVILISSIQLIFLECKFLSFHHLFLVKKIMQFAMWQVRCFAGIYVPSIYFKGQNH